MRKALFQCLRGDGKEKNRKAEKIKKTLANRQFL